MVNERTGNKAYLIDRKMRHYFFRLACSQMWLKIEPCALLCPEKCRSSGTKYDKTWWSTCAGPESFVIGGGGGATLTTFFVDEEREDLNTMQYKRAIIATSAKRH